MNGYWLLLIGLFTLSKQNSKEKSPKRRAKFTRIANNGLHLVREREEDVSRLRPSSMPKACERGQRLRAR